jgi:predicted acyltransferase
MAVVTPSTSPAPAGSGRLVSLDALRGFTMFWILGADITVMSLAKWIDIAPLRLAAHQVDHAAWAGFRFYDLIFPMFVFITGVSLIFSVEKSLARDGRRVVVRHILVRTAVLFLLGILYNGGLAQPWPEVRLVGVLQRIALAYGAAALLVVFCSARVRAGVVAGLLVGYWALLTFVPIRDITLERGAMAAQLGQERPSAEAVRALYDATSATVTGRYEPGLNLTNHLDYLYLPGRMYDVYWDPEGMLSTLPAIATCLLGVMAGSWLRRRDRSEREKLLRLALAGAACLALGWLWHLQFPVVKKIWTSSFVLVAGGWSLLFLAAFAWIIDVRGWRGWCVPFVWIGMNPITLYLATSLVDFGGIASRLAGGSVARGLDSALGAGAGGFVISLLVLLLLIAVARFLHRRGIHLKV